MVLPEIKLINHAKTKHPSLTNQIVVSPLSATVSQLSEVQYNLVVVDNYHSNVYGSAFDDESLNKLIESVADNCNAIVIFW